jgi:hypothetical protein
VGCETEHVTEQLSQTIRGLGRVAFDDDIKEAAGRRLRVRRAWARKGLTMRMLREVELGRPFLCN